MVRTTRGRRSAFTLLEILIVTLIIAALVALLLPALASAFTRAAEVGGRNDIAQLDASHAAARRELGDINYLPSQIILYENISDYASATPGSVAAESAKTLNKMFPNIFKTSGAKVDWNGDGSIAAVGTGYTLYADRSLIFYLGGIPGSVYGSGQTPLCLGFSTNPVNPAASGGTRKGPYFDFQSPRLIQLSDGFYQYGDTYGVNASGARTPFLYFSSRGNNDYTPADAGTTGVSPYYGSLISGNPNYINPKTYQIICAGADHTFGPGGAWDPTKGYGNVAPPSGADDQANFSPYLLGKPSN